MTWRLPVFNLTANVWHGILPPSLAGPTGLPPDVPPDLSPICQLYLSKYGPGGWFHAWPDDIRITLERAGYITLRCPLDTDVRAPWMPTPALTWADLDLVEVPANSGRYYAAVMVEQAHAGFANEYRIAILAQIALTTPSGFPGDGFWVPTAPVDLDAGGGGGADGNVVPSGRIDLDAGGGGGADADVLHGILADLDVGGGGGADASAVPGGPVDLDAGGGGGADATVTSGSGTVTPGTTCAGAALITLPFTQAITIAAGGTAWLKFAGTAGTTYHLRVSGVTGTVNSATLGHGACPTPTTDVLFGSPYPNCGSFPLVSSGTVFVEISCASSPGATCTVEVATGIC